jgi:uncharacterized membrane protein HdeD (DUF308 family)
METSPITQQSHEQAAGELWWLPIVTGSLWILLSLLLFRFDYTSVNAVSVLLGVVCLGGALEEALLVPASHGWWRFARIALAVLFTIIGIVAFVHPGNTFNALAAVFAFFLLLRGLFTVIASISHLFEPTWLGILLGLAEIGLAFWAAGDFGHKAVLLVIWVGASALIHGLMDIVLAFRLRSFKPS